MLLKFIRGDKDEMKVGDIFSQMNKFWPLFFLFAIQMVTLLIGAVLLFIPMLILNCFYLYTAIIMVENNVGVIESIKRSYRTVMNGGFGVNFLIGICTLALSSVPGLIPHIGWLISCATGPLGALLIVFSYIQHEYNENTV